MEFRKTPACLEERLHSVPLSWPLPVHLHPLDVLGSLISQHDLNHIAEDDDETGVKKDYSVSKRDVLKVKTASSGSRFVN